MERERETYDQTIKNYYEINTSYEKYEKPSAYKSINSSSVIIDNIKDDNKYYNMVIQNIRNLSLK